MLIQNIKIAADSLVFSKGNGQLQLLLIERGNEPFKGMWAFPGGFVEDDGKFHERPQAAKVANKAKQTKKPVKKLHSEDLKAFKGK